MKKFIFQAVFLIIVIMAALAYYTQKLPTLPFINQPAKFGAVTIGETVIKVEIADTQEKRAKGLGGRQTLATDSGMLFIFDRVDKHGFWMKGLSFPLDFIWIKDQKVVDIYKNAPPVASGQQDKELPIYVPSEPVNMVLEVNAGFSDSHNIKVGDTVSIKKNQ